MALALLYSAGLTAAAPACDLTGNWTDGTPHSTTHIQFWQNASGEFLLRTTPWNAEGLSSHGHFVENDEVSLLMVGGGMKSSKVVANPDVKGAPPCTYLASIGWCKFPYCGFPEPSWPPFKPDKPAPPGPPPSPPEVKLSCGVDRSKPCPVPTWTPTWDLARSTAIQPCNSSGWYDPVYAAKWGLVSFDWSNAKADWLAVSPPDCEERLVEQCKKIKTINPDVKCFVYRNTELALEWLSSQRAVMDEAHAGFFLNFQGENASAKCTAAGPCTYSSNGGPPARPAYKYGDFCCPFANVYCENQDPWQGERQFFWDFTNASLQRWWVDEFFMGKNGAGSGNKWVDGCFSDDVGGLPQEHEQAIARMGYTSDQTHTLQIATQKTWQKAVENLAGAGGYNWQVRGLARLHRSLI